MHHHRSRRCVLVVDDDPDQREVLAAVLRSEGSFDVTVARDGAEGLQKARAGHPDVVVTDFTMPQMDGGELAKRLAADESTRGIPVVMVSAMASSVPGAARRACAACIQKPCEPDELTRIVSGILATRVPA